MAVQGKKYLVETEKPKLPGSLFPGASA